MDVHRSALATLEEAELRARERRLQASAEAERRLADAAAQAASIEAAVAARIEDALAVARRASKSRVHVRLAELDAEAARDDATSAGPDDLLVSEAAELIVAAVLGEARA